jgi:hypothetical protein
MKRPLVLTISASLIVFAVSLASSQIALRRMRPTFFQEYQEF